VTQPAPVPPPTWTWVETGLGRWLVAATAQGVGYLGLAGEASRADFRRWAEGVSPGVPPMEAAAGLPALAATQLVAYTKGQRRDFDLPLDLRGTDFQRAVWSQLLAIPYGATRTYGELAARLGRPGASRAVGLAAGRNPLPVIVPCHRLVATGGLGGFSAGLGRKRVLLSLERGGTGRQAELDFDPHPGA
jgi:methylated-DNA-[protein]-cysteine S-methyltransferase